MKRLFMLPYEAKNTPKNCNSPIIFIWIIRTRAQLVLKSGIYLTITVANWLQNMAAELRDKQTAIGIFWTKFETFDRTQVHTT